MKIHSFYFDEVGFPRASCELDNGARIIAVVWHQYGYYIRTGSAIEKNLTRHHFTQEQNEAFDDFFSSGEPNREFSSAII